MVYHNIINSSEERISRAIILQQEKYGHEKCWAGNAKQEAEQIGIELNAKKVTNKPKSVWEKEVKEKIGEEFERTLDEEKSKKKLRFLKGKKGIQRYLNSRHAVDALRIRLNMITWIADNVGGKETCPLCGEMDTTEHVFGCEAVPNDQNLNSMNLENGEKMEEIAKLFADTENMRREHWLENIEENFDQWRREGTLWE